jgi:hypothetical protein
MGNTTLANNLSPVTKGSNGVVLAAPDICKTPTPGGPAPLPYPNVSKSGDLAKGSSTVKVDGHPVCLCGKSNFSMSTGDEAGSAGGGVASSKIKGSSRPLAGSPNIKIEGKAVVRNAEMFIANKDNTPPAPVAQAQVPPSPPPDHSPDGECPFCPPPKKKTYTTYPGASNESGILSAFMDDPTKLGKSRESGARPKDGGEEHQPASIPRPKPEPIFTTSAYGDYSCEPHHAISGNGGLKGHDIEKWLCKSGEVDADSGYSVNNSDNGVWLPSIPEKMKNGSWSPLSDEKKLEIASLPMDAGKGQFHKGNHNIGDPSDPDAGYHFRYPEVIKDRLTLLKDRIVALSGTCPNCKTPKPFQVNWKINRMMDRLSNEFIRDLRKPAPQWEFFISRLALNYHRKDCTHSL